MAVNIYFLRLTAILQSLSIIQAKDKNADADTDSPIFRNLSKRVKEC